MTDTPDTPDTPDVDELVDEDLADDTELLEHEAALTGDEPAEDAPE